MKVLIYIILISSIVSCEQNMDIGKRKAHYLFLAHTRTDKNPGIDRRVENIDINKYDLLLLGGDLSQLSSEDEASMSYLDRKYQLGSDNTLFAPGNHDYSNPKLISNSTHRESYYAIFCNGITFLVLDTERDQCRIIHDQFKMVKNVCDTIQVSSHLIVLSHKLLWMYDHKELQKKAAVVPNAGIGDKAHMINPNNFNSEVLPLLSHIQKEGVQVICIGGDIGFKAKSFEYQDQQGIWFLASGINYKDELNYGLRIDHDLDRKEVSWSFVPLESL